MQTITTAKEHKKEEGEYTPICQAETDPKKQSPMGKSRCCFVLFLKKGVKQEKLPRNEVVCTLWEMSALEILGPKEKGLLPRLCGAAADLLGPGGTTLCMLCYCSIT